MPTDTLSYNIDGEGVVRFNSSLDYSNANQIFLTSPQGWGGNAITGGQDGFINSPNIKDELTALRFSVSRELDKGFLKAVDVGVNYTTRDKDYDPDRYFLGLVANASDPQHDSECGRFPRARCCDRRASVMSASRAW